MRGKMTSQAICMFADSEYLEDEKKLSRNQKALTVYFDKIRSRLDHDLFMTLAYPVHAPIEKFDVGNSLMQLILILHRSSQELYKPTR